MPGWSNADNKFGPTDFVVGPILGAGCNYTVIQTAINDAFAAGGGTILIRPGTYTEDLILQPTVDLVGVCGDGREFPALVNIIGTHSRNGNGITVVENIFFDQPAGITLAVFGFAGTTPILAIKNCRVLSDTNVAISVNAIPGSNAIVSLISCEVTGQLNGIQVGGQSTLLLENDVNVTSNSVEGIFINGVSTIIAKYSSVTGFTVAMGIFNNFANVTFSHCNLLGQTDSTVFFNTGGNFFGDQNTHNSGNAATFYVSGPGNYS